MTFNQIWDQLCSKKPSLKRADSTLEFKPENLKALLRQVYEQGRKSAEYAGKSDYGLKDTDGPFGDLFKNRRRG